MRLNLEMIAIALVINAALRVVDVLFGLPIAIAVASLGLVAALWLLWRWPA
ncbi:hypothetical protein ABE527_05040 [Brucella sp. TWI432]